MATPPPPGFFKKVNYVVDFVLDPCHAPIIVYIELAAVPFGDLVLAWLTFGWDDVVRGYLRPTRALRGGRSFRRGKRPKGWRRLPGYLKKIPGIGDDVGNWLGKKIPGNKELAGRTISQGEKFVWIIDGLIQRLLLYWLIADITSDFFYEWATLIDATEFCEQRTNGSFYNDGLGVAISPHTGWGSTGAPIEHWEDGPITFGFTAGFAFARKWTIISAYTAENKGPNPITWEQRLVVNYLGGQKIYLSGPVVIPVDGQASTVVVGVLQGPVGFSIEQKAIGGIAFGVQQDVWGFGDRR